MDYVSLIVVVREGLPVHGKPQVEVVEPGTGADQFALRVEPNESGLGQTGVVAVIRREVDLLDPLARRLDRRPVPFAGRDLPERSASASDYENCREAPN